VSDTESSDYALWVQLANDPSQSEEVRQQCRAQMEAYLHKKMREAFQVATRQASGSSKPASH
jgi:flagellar biosynthesis protein FliP